MRTADWIFFLPLLSWKKNKTQNLNQTNKKPTKLQTPEKCQSPHSQEKGKELHTPFNTSNIHFNSFKSFPWSVSFPENSFPFLFLHFVLILWDIFAWSVFTTVTKDFSFCCWILLIFNTVTSDILCSGLALKKKLLCIYMLKIKKLCILCVLQWIQGDFIISGIAILHVYSKLEVRLHKSF